MALDDGEGASFDGSAIDAWRFPPSMRLSGLFFGHHPEGTAKPKKHINFLVVCVSG